MNRLVCMYFGYNAMILLGISQLVTFFRTLSSPTVNFLYWYNNTQGGQCLDNCCLQWLFYTLN